MPTTCGGRRWISWAGLVLALALAPARGRAEKKKPGLFDFETWKSPVTREREAAKDLAPGQLDVTPLGERRLDGVALRLRVYADRDYRGGLHWQTKFRTQLDRLNRVVQPLFGVWFEVEGFRDWDRSHTGVGLDKVLEELWALDRARDVDWVVGLVTPFRGVATDVHLVGMAPLSSRHFVLRAMDDAQEGLALDRELAMLSPGERDKLYGDRKAHKELVVFLHEWAHTMGVLHVEDRAMLMNPLYDPKQAAFTDFEKRLIELVLEKRTGDRTKAFPEAAELAALVRAAPPDEGTKAERDDLLRSLAAHGPEAPPPPARQAAAAAGDPDTPPANDPAALQAHLALARRCARARRFPEAEKHYRRALLLAPSDPTAWIELGRLYRATGSETQRDRLAREHEALFSTPLPP